MTYRIIPPREPLVNIKTGEVTRSWYRFFEHLGEGVGPGNSSGSSGGTPSGGGGAGTVVINGPTSIVDLAELWGAQPLDTAGLYTELEELRTLAFLPELIPSLATPTTIPPVPPPTMEEGCCLPLVNGDLPGPTLMSDGYGQCIAVPIGAEE